MAKIKMVCPFSNKLCEECALYRGRHYYMCFSQKYRGYLGEPKKATTVSSPFASGARPDGKFEIPVLTVTRAIGPSILYHGRRQKEV